MKRGVILTVAAAAVYLVAGSTSPCPPGFVDLANDTLNPNCVAFVLSVGTWEHMKYRCENLGANLTKVEGTFHATLYDYIQETPGLPDHCFWLGGTDAEEEGRWIWDSDGSEVRMDTLSWDPCTVEPNGGTNQNHICICPDDYFFHDCNNDDMIYGICQL